MTIEQPGSEVPVYVRFAQLDQEAREQESDPKVALAEYNARRDHDTFAALDYVTQRTLIDAAVGRLPSDGVRILIEHLTDQAKRTYAIVRLDNHYATYLVAFGDARLPSRSVFLDSGNYDIYGLATAVADLERRMGDPGYDIEEDDDGVWLRERATGELCGPYDTRALAIADRRDV